MHKGLSLVALALAASIVTAKPVPKAIRAEYRKVERALKKADVKTFKGFFDTSFVNVDDKGTKTEYAAFMTQLDEIFKGAVSGTANEKLLSAEVNDDTVDVKFDFHFSIKSDKGVSVGHEIGTDTWKKINGRWLFVKTVDTFFELKPTQ